jgi:hypothetical protein
MRINFLTAADGTPLTKQYTLKGDDYVATPYPFVRDFSSFEYEVDSIQDLFAVLTEHSKHQHCLLKGMLDKKLDNESRAGHTNANTASHFAVFDLDFSDGFANIEHFVKTVMPEWQDASYILQHSNSAGITSDKGLRCHLYFHLEKYQPAHMKQWLIHKNLMVKELRDMVELSANGMSLRYPLDITTCQNDKIIYIARPLCSGFEDPLGDERMILVEKEHAIAPGKLEFINPQRNAELTDNLVAELRATAGIKKKTAKYANKNPNGVLLNPDIAAVTAIRSGRGFTYLNLNEGDSWAYYFPTDNPELLFNFKGEPTVRLQDIVPEYYDSLTIETDEADEILPHVFRDRSTDQYYNLLYNRGEGTITSLDMVGSKPKMVDFLAQYDRPFPDFVEDWTLEFDPRTITVFDERNKWINSFAPSVYLRKQYDPVPRVPMVIDKVLKSICVDEEYYGWFINWLAYIIQTRLKSGVAPVFSGVPGTGKGILHEKILQPILGFGHTPKLTTQGLTDQFNNYIETAIVLNWDEALVESETDGLIDKLKHLITENHTVVRGMRQNSRKIRNYVNLFISTNHNNPMPLPPNDRRFSIAPPQMTPIEISDAEVNLIEDELPMFMGYIQAFEVDTVQATTIPKNQARKDMVESSMNTVDAFFEAIRTGDFDYFLSFRRSEVIVGLDHAYLGYEELLRKIAPGVNVSGDKSFISRDDAMALYSYIIAPYHHPARFKKMGTKYHLSEGRHRANGKQIRGWKTNWVAEDEESVELLMADNVVKIKSAF